MPSEFTVDIKVDEFLKKYIEHRYGTQDGVLNLPKNSPLKKKVQLFLSKPPANPRKDDGKKALLTILLPYAEKDPRVYNWLPVSCHRLIEDFILDVYFYVDFLEFMAASLNGPGKIQNAIYGFIEARGLTIDDIDFERLKKKWYRHRQALLKT